MIKAIPTYYNGNFYKSRIEAKWAVFFDRLDIEYKYEDEGYDLGCGVWYLPDFYLPELDIFIEIKGKIPSYEERGKADFLAKGLDKKVFIFYGNIPNPDKIDMAGDDGKNYESSLCFFGGGEDLSYKWCECSDCGKLGIEYNARSQRLCDCPGKGLHPDKGYNGNTQRLKTAYRIARNYDFKRK